MSYQGKKFSILRRSMEKRPQKLEERNLFDHFLGTHKNGMGSLYRRRKRMEKKKQLEAAAERKKRANTILEEAAALEKEAASYEPWGHEEAQVLLKKAKLLRAQAEALTDGRASSSKEAERTLSTLVRKPAPRVYPTVRPTVYTYEPDPQVVALKDAILSGERNFMNGISYRINPVDTMKMITASSVFGEPQYYRGGDRVDATVLDGTYGIDELFTKYSLSMLDPFRGMKTSQVMEKAIDEALTADFEATLKWAVELREKYLMRLNPQVILVRAAIHPGRPAYTETHPGKFAEYALQIMPRGDDVIHQAEYWLSMNGNKNGIPAILKRSWATRIGQMDAYSMAKYANSGMGLVDVVRLCHAKGPLVDTLMRTGRVPMPESKSNWERLRASGMSWHVTRLLFLYR